MTVAIWFLGVNVISFFLHASKRYACKLCLLLCYVVPDSYRLEIIWGAAKHTNELLKSELSLAAVENPAPGLLWYKLNKI